jgi:hypothetical protein
VDLSRETEENQKRQRLRVVFTNQFPDAALIQAFDPHNGGPEPGTIVHDSMCGGGAVSLV